MNNDDIKYYMKLLIDNSVYYSMDNFSVQRHHILLSQKQKTFPQFFAAFLKSTLNFEHFQKKR